MFGIDERGGAADQVDPDAFLRFGYARLLESRQPRYAAMAEWGVSVTAEEVSRVRDAAGFDDLIAAALDRVHVVAGRLIRRIRRHPQHELVECEHRHRRQVLPVERHARRERRREQVRQRDDDLVGIALRPLHVEEAFGPGAARLVDDDQRLLHQVVLGDHALEEARHLVGAAAGAGRKSMIAAYSPIEKAVTRPSFTTAARRPVLPTSRHCHGATSRQRLGTPAAFNSAGTVIVSSSFNETFVPESIMTIRNQLEEEERLLRY